MSLAVRRKLEATETGMVSPLQPKEFFRGVWVGEGELIPHPLLRWLITREHLRLRTEAVWLSETTWVVRDRFEFSSGRVLERKMFAELIAPDRIHVTADDMPLGAEILLFAEGFRFTPYRVLVSHRGRVYQFRCEDECWVDAEGSVHDTISTYFWRVPIATIRLGPIRREVSA